MPEKDSIANTTAVQPTNLRRSPRFLPAPKNLPEAEHQPVTTLRKSQRLVNREKSANPKTPKPKLRSRSDARSLNSSLSFKKSSKSNSGSVKSLRSDYGEEGFQSLRRSLRFCNEQNVGDKLSGKAKCGRWKSKASSSGDKEEFSAVGKDGVFVSSPDRVSKKSKRVNRRSSVGGELVCLEGREKEVEEFVGSPNMVSKMSKRVTRRSSVGGELVSLEGRVKKVEDYVGSPNRVSRKSRRATRRTSVGGALVSLEGREKKVEEFDGGNKEVGGVRSKRKREEEGIGGVQGWTKEQELSLQRAYLIAKPTPNFWKKVSKLVPGKSAQECFDRVHSEHITPPQPRTRSRAEILTNSSPLGQFSLSASKLLKPTEPKAKRPSCNKERSYPAHKTVRKLLQKHSQVYQDYEADLFSVLEPSTQSHPSVIPSTPKNLQEKQGSLQKCSQRCSGYKKPLSRFSTSCGAPLVSPPVLKQVRNRVWHEKYIDQLHNREAKRKAAASTCTQKSNVGILDRKKSHVPEVDVVRTAKMALVCDARGAINKLQHLQANAVNNSSDLNGDAIVTDDEEGEEDDDTL